LSHQAIEGYWIFSEKLLSLINLDINKFGKFNSQLGANFDNDTLVTLLVLAYFQVHKDKYGASVSVIKSKAKKWLNNKIDKSQGSVNNYIEKIVKLRK